MATALILISFLGGLALLWLDSARARELATELVLASCKQRDLQLLDGTVQLQRTGLRWGKNGLRIRRMFGFDFSVEGATRRSGYLILLGTQLEQFDLGLPRQSSQAGEEKIINPEVGRAGKPKASNVVPIKPKDKKD